MENKIDENTHHHLYRRNEGEAFEILSILIRLEEKCKKNEGCKKK